MPTVSYYIGKLNKYYQPDEHIAVAIWCEEDIIKRAKERGKKITKEQAQDILDLIDRKQDCTLGISWDTLDAYTDDYLKEGDFPVNTDYCDEPFLEDGSPNPRYNPHPLYSRTK